MSRGESRGAHIRKDGTAGLISIIIIGVLGLLFFITLAHAHQGGNGDAEAPGQIKHAFMIQSGIQGQIDTTQRQLENVGKYYVGQWGLEPEVAAIGVGYAGYKSYKARTISFPLTKKQRITLHQNSVNWELKF